jgi:hypothetical protein
MSRRVQIERARELTDWVLSMPHASSLDWASASEIGRLLAMSEALDNDLASRGVTTGSGAVRGAAKLRLECTRAILQWTNAMGMNAKSRAEIIASLREVNAPSFSESYASRLAQLRAGNGQGDG